MAEYAYKVPDALDTQQKLLYLIALGQGVSSGLIAANTVSEGIAPQTIGRSAATSNGSVPSGYSRVTMVSDASFSGTVQGVLFPASYTESYIAQNGRVLDAINYTRSAGTLYITVTSA